MKRSLVTTGSMLAISALLVIGAGPAQAAPAPGFYDLPAVLPANNGDLIRSEPSVFFLDPLHAVRAPASVERIMYKSTNSTGAPVAVTGTVLVPYAPWIGPGQRPVLGYAVGTQGLGDQCAPSRALAAGTEYEGVFIKGLLARGYSVVVTDYEGLGTASKHTYMARASQGHAVLDGIRAAQRRGDPQITASTPVGLAGYSQGGGASASAAELAPSYAPELKLKGAYAGAVPSDLGAMAGSLDGGLYTAFLLYALSGISESAGVDVGAYLNQAGRAKLAATEGECTVQSIAASAFFDTATLTAGGGKASALLAVPEFKAAVDEQKIGNGRSPKAPVYLSHSVFDDVIPYSQGKGLTERWCAAGSSVYLDTNAAPTHVGGYAAAFPAAFAFLERTFAGRTALSNCWLMG